MANYYRANKQRMDARMWAWRRAHPDYYRQYHAARRAAE